MKKKLDFRILIIIVLTIVLIVMCYFYFKDDSSEVIDNIDFSFDETDENVSSSENESVLTATSEVQSSLSENLALHATYYLEECYVQTNVLVRSGENILKYTNGTYLTSPYDCVVTEINVPSENEKCTNEHYIKISSVNSLQVQLMVDETKINEIQLGRRGYDRYFIL